MPALDDLVKLATSSDFLVGILSNAAFALGGAIASLGLSAYRHDRRKFAGRWEMTIDWTQEWGDHLLGGSCTDPRSSGDVSLSFGAGEKRDQYYGIGYFRLFSGVEQYSHLAVRLSHIELERPFLSGRFPWVWVSQLRRMRIETLVRERLREFDYPTVAQYEVLVRESSSSRIVASVRNDKRSIVGQLIAQRVY